MANDIMTDGNDKYFYMELYHDLQKTLGISTRTNTER